METNHWQAATSLALAASNDNGATAIDRVAPTRRPHDKVVGYQTWQQLLFVHWAIDAALLRPQVPEQLELDLLDGVAYVGIVPFWMEGVRPWWWPARWAFSFWETNLRTYVLHNGEPGVYFFSLDATSRLAVRAARFGWSLPYFDADIRSQRVGNEVTYELQRRRDPAQLRVRYRIGAPQGPAQKGTIDCFLLERYLLFTRRGDKVLRGQVHHTPYPAQQAEVLECEQSLLQSAGLPPAAGAPLLAHYAEGVQVEIFPLRAVELAK